MSKPDFSIRPQGRSAFTAESSRETRRFIGWGLTATFSCIRGAVLIWRSDYSATCTNGSVRSVTISGSLLMDSCEANPLFLPDRVYELRMPKTRQGTTSGYFNDVGLLYKAAAALDGKVPGLYVTLNAVNSALLARAKNRLQPYAKSTTSDADILKREWILIDCDAVRPAEISSTDAEHHAACNRCNSIADWLGSQGWPEPVRADSGNGGHLLYRIDLPNDDASRDLVKAVLEVLALKFNDSVVTVDTGVYNAARITKLYGTMVCKGDSTEDRPHRRSQILSVPERTDSSPAGSVEIACEIASGGSTAGLSRDKWHSV